MGKRKRLDVAGAPRLWRLRLAQAAAGLRADISFAAVDAGIVLVAYTAALVLRLTDGQGVSAGWWAGFRATILLIVIVHVVCNVIFGAYGHVWEFASVEEAMRLVMAVVASSVVLLGGLLAHQALGDHSSRILPLMVILLGSGLSLGGMGAVRFRSRLFSFHRRQVAEPSSVLVVGTDRAAADLARRGSDQRGRPLRVLGFVSTDGTPGLRRLAGLQVVGDIDDLPVIARALAVDEVIVAAAPGDVVVRRVVDLCMAIDVKLTLLGDMRQDAAAGSGLRDVRDLELSDLLPRPIVRTDLAAVGGVLSGKRVLVTGAGGTIGAEIVSQVLEFGAAEVIALDHDEGHLYEAMLCWSGRAVTPRPLLCDIRDANAIRGVFEAVRPHVVFHAAAHKHVPILEAHPAEAVKTNITGTLHLLEQARRVGVERFVLISTDKAVEPSSVMGASKRVAEMATQNAARRSGDCVFASVRFGNVLGSRGSVVPTFMGQIQAGGPVTVSDPDMLRYFMLNFEAVELVLQAAALAEGGEIFVLDMGEPVRIGDLARRMIRLAGLVPGTDIEVVVTGPRPGEKKVERLSRGPLRPSAHPQINLASAHAPGAVTLHDAVQLLEQLAHDGDEEAIRDVLMALAWHEWVAGEVIVLDDLVGETLRAPA
ncbi:MAG TPA: polysaccharide biosynthesis protein [Acidimicrobiia bacterium]|nr:polysaccharide biosynthesis protein [Acidimicrobiia bacterium]